MSEKTSELAKLSTPQFLRDDTIVALAAKVLGTEESARTVLTGALGLHELSACITAMAIPTFQLY